METMPYEIWGVPDEMKFNLIERKYCNSLFKTKNPWFRFVTEIVSLIPAHMISY